MLLCRRQVGIAVSQHRISQNLFAKIDPLLLTLFHERGIQSKRFHGVCQELSPKIGLKGRDPEAVRLPADGPPLSRQAGIALRQLLLPGDVGGADQVRQIRKAAGS